ncbi:MAG: hypothetical protein KC731_33615, partial [Myxococcales bacterium]|nr:hypothetical protein [Myxococcales bacterium]
MDVLLDVLGFSGKALVVFLTFTACVVVLFARFGARQQGDREDGRLKIRHLNRSLEAKVNGLRAAMLDRKARRAAHKQEKAAEKHRVPKPRRVFVLDFKGDVMASRVESLRDEITALLGVATKEDEVVL